jgi:hypothetical protein
MTPKPHSEVKVRRPRCSHVQAILLNRVETLELIREEAHPPVGDFAEGSLQMAVVRWNGLEVYVPLECVVFLGQQPYAKRSKNWSLKVLAAKRMYQAHGKHKKQLR